MCIRDRLYVVTASQGEGSTFRQSAMVASWVSQASFSPPGITVAVAKDRAIESYMQVGKGFVVNILREDNYQKMFRHFLKRFAPGADRLADVDIINNIAKGGPYKCRHRRSYATHYSFHYSHSKLP